MSGTNRPQQQQPSGDSKERLMGRRLVLTFAGHSKPQLHKVEFRHSDSSKTASFEQVVSAYFSWTAVPQALSLLCLDYLYHASHSPHERFLFRGPSVGNLPASLSNAKYTETNFIHDLFVDLPLGGGRHPCFDQAIKGKAKGERCNYIDESFLPPDCIEIYWDAFGATRLTEPPDIKMLSEKVRLSLKLPLPKDVKTSAPKPPPTENRNQRPETASVPPSSIVPESDPNPPAPLQVTMPESFLNSMSMMAKALFRSASADTPTQATTPPPSRAERTKASTPELAKQTGSDFSFQPKSSPKADESTGSKPDSRSKEPEHRSESESQSPPPIDPGLFTIHNPHGYSWEDSHPLLDFGNQESGPDLWELKDASQGVLILGAPNSGKTSGSGFILAESFLEAGFGGLVLTAKPDEAQRWIRRCARYGRAEDCIVVTPDGPHKLNILAYETQRPRSSLGITEDLIAFFRVLISIVSNRKPGASQTNEEFWTGNTDVLMRQLFNVFMLAKEPFTVDRLVRFINRAPKKETNNWKALPLFGEILTKAENGIASREDSRIFQECREYWTIEFPAMPEKPRSSIIMGFTAMAAVLSARGIYEMISGETNLTPEMALSGKIIILSLPLKECGQGGLLIQAAWKYLLQRAIERRADKGQKTATPCFIWEDEAHLFFSQHDIEFQPTARDCRAPHVIMSQSLHNFLHLGHNHHSVMGVFGTMNTHIYHANGDLESNEYCSKRIGTEIRTFTNYSSSSQTRSAGASSEQSSGTGANESEKRERVFEPESFQKLKMGGTGFCQAVILWVSHQFKANKGKPYCFKDIRQEPKD